MPAASSPAHFPAIRPERRAQILDQLKLILFLVAMLVVAQPATDAAEVIGDPYVYKTVGARPLRLYVIKGEDGRPETRRPAIVFFHGGGWVNGEVGQLNEQSRYLAERGMVCVQVEYRLIEANTTEPPTVCIQDAKSAMRWVRANAGQLGVDPQKIAAGGAAAGGHLAAFASLVEGMDDPGDDLSVSPRGEALVLFNPVFDNGPDQGWGYERVGTRYREFSPADHVTPQAPPTIVFFGTHDHLVPMAVVERFKAKMDAAGVRCDVMLYPGQDHGFFNWKPTGSRFYYETLLATDRFFESLGWLKGPPTLGPPRP